MSRHSRQQGPTVYLLVEIRKQHPHSREVGLVRDAIHRVGKDHGILLEDVPFPHGYSRYTSTGWARCGEIMSEVRNSVWRANSARLRTPGRHRKDNR